MRQFHANTRGAISVLVLLTLWCLVALVGMLWNTAEYSVSRQKIQTVTDSVAYGIALYKARGLNQVAAQNMLIAQDASADVIFRATGPTYTNIYNRLNKELIDLELIEKQRMQLQSQLPGIMSNIDSRFTLLQGALSVLQQSAAQMKFPNKQAAIIYNNKIRQAIYAANWVQTVYVPQLDALAQQAIDIKVTQQMIDEARGIIGDPNNPQDNTESGFLRDFQKQTSSAPADTSDQLRQQEELIFSDEQAIVEGMPATMEQEAQTLEGYYNFHSNYGKYGAAMISGDQVVNTPTGEHQMQWTDSIRTKFPNMGRNPQVVIDPISPNTKEIGDSDIVHPGVNVIVPGIPAPVHIDCNAPGGEGWGHCYCFPIERYLSGRVVNDRGGLETQFMAPIDLLRMKLAQIWAKDLGLLMNVPALPAEIPDPQPDPITKQPVMIRILPDLTPPDAANGDKTPADFDYRRAAASYLAAVHQLEMILRNYAGIYNEFTVPYAVPRWEGNVSLAHHEVIVELGQDFTQGGTSRGIMVLQCYQLAPIPEWAQAGMRDSLTQSVFWQIYTHNNVLWNMSPQGAESLLKMWGDPVNDIVEEMMARPWPYEKTPPSVPVPPTRGMNASDRLQYFSQIVTCISTERHAPKIVFPQIFGNYPPMLAYAQGEAFNWMEYNDSYGSYYTEKFDEVSLNAFSSLLACPRAWRLSSRGGMNWRPRLSMADGLPGTIANDPEGEEVYQSAGFNVDKDAFPTVNFH